MGAANVRNSIATKMGISCIGCIGYGNGNKDLRRTENMATYALMMMLDERFLQKDEPKYRIGRSRFQSIEDAKQKQKELFMSEIVELAED